LRYQYNCVLHLRASNHVRIRRRAGLLVIACVSLLAKGYMSSPGGERDFQKKHVLLLTVRPVLRSCSARPDGADGPHIDFCMESAILPAELHATGQFVTAACRSKVANYGAVKRAEKSNIPVPCLCVLRWQGAVLEGRNVVGHSTNRSLLRICTSTYQTQDRMCV
jgi:hypothetical protein